MYLPKSENDLIETYLPNYSNRNDVFRLDVLQRYLDNELNEAEIKEFSIESLAQAKKEHTILLQDLFTEALLSYINIVCELQREQCVKSYVSNMYCNSPLDNIRFAIMPPFE